MAWHTKQCTRIKKKNRELVAKFQYVRSFSFFLIFKTSTPVKRFRNCLSNGFRGCFCGRPGWRPPHRSRRYDINGRPAAGADIDIDMFHVSVCGMHIARCTKLSFPFFIPPIRHNASRSMHRTPLWTRMKKKTRVELFFVLFVHYRAGLANIASCMQNAGEDKGRFQQFRFCFCWTFSALWETHHSRQFPLQVCHAEVIVQTWLWFAIASSLVVSPINVGIRSLTLTRRQWPRQAKNKQEKSF